MLKNTIKKKIQLSLLCSILISSNLIAQDNKSVKLGDIDIVEQDGVIKVLKRELIKIPGGTNLIDLEAMPTAKSTLNDVLGKEPGVIVQEFFGANDQPRLNIRGSGVQSNPVNNGVNLLYNGLSINQADGSFVIGVLDPQQHSAVSVYRGSNAMKYGSASLRGALNFVSKNALNSKSFIDLQVGSNNTQNLNIGAGIVQDDVDLYFTTGFSKSDGFRSMSDSERKNASFNIGYQINDNIENRTLLNYTDNFFHIPFVVPKQVAADHPTAIVGDGYAGNFENLLNVYKRKPHRDTEQFRISNNTTFKVDENTEHNIGIYAEKMDDTFKDPLSHQISENDNVGISLSTKGANAFIDQDSYELSLAYNKGSMPIEYWVNSSVDGSKVFKYADYNTPRKQERKNKILIPKKLK